MSFSEWREVNFGELVESVSTKHKFNRDKIVLINTSDILEGKVLNHTYVENKNLKGQFKKSFQKGDILYSEIRPKNKRFAYINFDADDYVASTKLMVLRKRIDNVDRNFIFQLLKSEEIINRLQVLAESRSGTFPQITFTELSKLKVKLPPFKVQKSIAHILSTIDDKIEINDQINENLQSISQLLFKHWFVDFEFPNEEGNSYQSSGGEMVESELGMIPKGWKVNKVNDIASVIGGGTPSTKKEEYYADIGIPWITPRDLSGYSFKFISRGSRDITEIGLKNSSAKLMPKGTVLFSSRAPIGYTVIAKNEVCTNQGFKSLAPKEGFGTEFIYYLIITDKEKIEGLANGSTFKEVSGQTLKDYKIVIPSKDILKKFEDISSNLSDMILKCEEEINTLSSLRDTLLPKLMNGEIDVSNIEINN